MTYVITYYTLGDSVQTEEVQADSLDAAIDVLVAEEEKQYCFAQLKGYYVKP